jgi:hypothetical protein
MTYENCLVTDESSLWDIHLEESNERYFQRILDTYGTDVRDLGHARIVDILERVETRRKPA